MLLVCELLEPTIQGAEIKGWFEGLKTRVDFTSFHQASVMFHILRSIRLRPFDVD